MVTLIALGGAGCLGTAVGDATHAKVERSGEITGTLRMIGGPAPGRRLLRHTGIRVYAADRLVARTTTDAHGTFRLVVAPGLYRLTLTDGSRLTPTLVHVAANEAGRLHLTLSVK
jgi:hypothetical protein